MLFFDNINQVFLTRFRLALVPLILLMLTFGACNFQKYVPEGKRRVVGNEIIFSKGSKIPNKKEIYWQLYAALRQHKNSPFRLWLHNTHLKGRKGLARFIRDKIGSKMVLLDTLESQKSAIRMERTLNSIGYFDAKVEVSHIFDGEGKFRKFPAKKKAMVRYTVTPNKLLLIDSINYSSPDSTIRGLVSELFNSTPLKKGQPLTTLALGEERARANLYFKNRGYYYYFPDYMQFEVDTFFTQSPDSMHQYANLYISITPPADTNRHISYTIDSIFINTHHNPIQKGGGVKMDTIFQSGYYFLQPTDGKPNFRRKALVNHLLLNKGRIYSMSDHRGTINKLRDLSAFKTATLDFSPSPDSTRSLLNCRINITQSKLMALGADFQFAGLSGDNALATSAGGGVGGSFSFKHNNLFKGSETFLLNAEGGVQFNLNRNGANPDLINTIDFKLEANLYLPRYIGLGLNKWLFRMNNPVTKFSLSYNLLERTNQLQYSSYNGTYGFQWKKGRNSFQLNQFSVSILDPLVLSDTYDTLLMNNPILGNAFEPYLITSLFGFNWNHFTELDRYKGKWNFFVRTESAGLLLYGMEKIGVPLNSLPIDYARFGIVDFEARYNRPVKRKSSLAWRAFAGIGVPYTDNAYLPYVRSYFGGGPNSLRAWRVREVGPGGDPLRDTTHRLDKFGDIKFETNLEYRFPLISAWYLEGAAFIDIGNVWTLRKNLTEQTLGHFDIERFWKELAIGTGIGVRLNLSFFVLRLDMGIPVHSAYPRNWSLDDGGKQSQWINAWNFNNLALNLAVGYPF